MGNLTSTHYSVEAFCVTHRPLDSKTNSIEGPQVILELAVGELLGKGNHSEVYAASEKGNSQQFGKVALKKTVYNPFVKDREIAVLRALKHVNVIKMFYFWITEEDTHNKKLNMVLEYMPTTVHHELAEATKRLMPIPLVEIKLWCYQMFRGIHYLHSMKVCHRDIKPGNLLLKRDSGLLKIGDLGSAKVLDSENEPTYIASRWYRAPELILNSTHVDNKIDIWACGCVVGELITGKALFPAYTKSPSRHFALIMTTLGTPSPKQFQSMHPKQTIEFTCQLDAKPWRKVLPLESPSVESASDLLTGLIQWSPDDRLPAKEACAHSFFDGVRDNKQLMLPNGYSIDNTIFE